VHCSSWCLDTSRGSDGFLRTPPPGAWTPSTNNKVQSETNLSWCLDTLRGSDSFLWDASPSGVGAKPEQQGSASDELVALVFRHLERECQLPSGRLFLERGHQVHGSSWCLDTSRGSDGFLRDASSSSVGTKYGQHQVHQSSWCLDPSRGRGGSLRNASSSSVGT